MQLAWHVEYVNSFFCGGRCLQSVSHTDGHQSLCQRTVPATTPHRRFCQQTLAAFCTVHQDSWTAHQSSWLSIPVLSVCLLLPGAELPLVESFGLLNDLFPLPSILDAGYPVFDLHLADVLCDVILPSVLGSSL